MSPDVNTIIKYFQSMVYIQVFMTTHMCQIKSNHC